MEAINLLKLWKNPAVYGEDTTINSTTNTNSTQIDFSMEESDNEIDEEEEEDSFFELEITLPNYDNHKNNSTQEQNHNSKHETFRSRDDAKIVDSNASRFKGSRILPIEPIPTKPQSPISILKSAPKFRVFMMGFKSPKTKKTEKTESNRASDETPTNLKRGQSKRIMLKFRVGNEDPVLSSFTRQSSSKSFGSKLQRQRSNDSFSTTDSSKRFSKDVVHKYLKLIKPLYVKVSKRYSDKVRLSDLLYASSPASSPAPAQMGSPKNIPAGFGMASKYLGKSRSSSVVSMVSPAPSRRDGSLLLQDDGIQSAILHCKRSLTSSRESSLLSRCTSDPTHEKLMEQVRKSAEK